jgi:hypothetical protein
MSELARIERGGAWGKETNVRWTAVRDAAHGGKERTFFGVGEATKKQYSRQAGGSKALPSRFHLLNRPSRTLPPGCRDF